jgi:hypothetical protein
VTARDTLYGGQADAAAGEVGSSPWFQLVTTPSSVLPMIASSEASTTAASRNRCSSALRRSVMSRIALETSVPSGVSRRLRPISTGNSAPSFRRP